MTMPEYFNSLTDSELLQHILFMLSTLVVMRICDWTWAVCKWLYNWIGSMFPTSLDKR